MKNIRILLTEGFTDEQLRRLFFETPEFRPVYDQLAEGTGKTEIIDLLLEYAYQTLQIDPLLDLVKEYNPVRFEEHQPYHENITDRKERPQYLAKLSSFKDKLTGNQIYYPIRQITDRAFWLIVISIPIIMISLMSIDFKIETPSFQLHITNLHPASAAGEPTPTPKIAVEWEYDNPNVDKLTLVIQSVRTTGDREGTVIKSIPIAAGDDPFGSGSKTLNNISIESLCREAYPNPDGQSIQFQMWATDNQGYAANPPQSNPVIFPCPTRLLPVEILPGSIPMEIPTPTPHVVTPNP